MLEFNIEKRPVIIADAGSNHHGESQRALRLIQDAANIGCDAITFDAFEKGYLPDLAARALTEEDWELVSGYCSEYNLMFGATCWTVRSLNTLKSTRYKPAFYKVPDLASSDEELLIKLNTLNKLVILSTGVNAISQVDIAVDLLKDVPVVLLHSTNIYPCECPQINLRAISIMARRYGIPVGYSSHENSHFIAAMAVGSGAAIIEKSLIIGDDKDTEAGEYSITSKEFKSLIEAIGLAYPAMGDGIKTIYKEEYKDYVTYR